MTADGAAVLNIAVAMLGGMAVGVERQWSGHASGSTAHFGGVRTFTLLGGVAGLSGWLASQDHAAAGAALVAASAALVIGGYLAASRRDIDATTETAGLVVIAAGFAAGLGHIPLASAVVAVTTLLLVEKTRLHALVTRINNQELRAAALFAVMAVVVLPLLPEGPIAGFDAVKPRELWLLVLLFSGLSFLGYIARRLFGAGHGYALAGLLAGIVSSTSVTFTFARDSRSQPAYARTLALGAIAACTMLFPRVLTALVILNVDVATAFLPYAIVPLLIGVATVVWQWRSSGAEPPHDEVGNPLHVMPALQMAITFQVVLIAVAWAHSHFGSSGLLASGAVLGLTDVDALTISMAKTSGATAAVAAQAIAIGILANCVLKSALAVAIGTRTFGVPVAATVGAMAVGIGASLVLFAL